MSPSSRNRPTRRWPAATLAALLGTATAGQAEAAQRKPTVTNGGYMQTRIVGDKTVALPLKHTDVDAEIAGMVASVQVTQVFQNPYKKPIEAVYVFPLPHRAAIYAMTIKVGKRTIKGLIKKRAEARRAYERARAQGKTAALLEQERPNIFTQSVANIMPGDTIKVKIRYAETMAPESGRYEFVFPMVVGPRYVGGGEAMGTRRGTGWGKDTTRIPDASRITPPLLKKGLRPGNDIAVRLRINGGVKVRHLAVVAHRASVSHDGQGATVTLSKRDSIPNKDFVVRYQLAGQRPRAAVLTHRDNRGGHFLLMIQPKARMQQRDIAPREYVFVVDNSGSMYGFPLQQARAVIKRSLENLRPTDTFNIIKFAGQPDQLARRAIRATPANIRRGVGYVAQMRGGGGTEFLPALKLALLAKKDRSRSRIVLFVTDGYIGYERQVLRFLRENIKGINLFALGIGSSVNRFLIDGMARIGVGSPFYLLNTEKAASVTERIFSTISKPALTSIDIDWGGLDVEELTPSAVPDLFGEKPVFVVGRFGKGGTGTVTVRGRLAGRPFRQKLQVTLPEARSGANGAVAYLWARRQIADQMDVFATEPNRAKEVEKSVTRVALRYSLMSRWTSFVAVDSAVRNQGGQQATVPVPVPLPDGVSPNAAPRGAFVTAAPLEGYSRAPARRKYSARYSSGYGGGRGRLRARRPMPRPKPPASVAPTPAAEPPRDEDAADRPARTARQHRALTVRLDSLRVSGSTGVGRIQARLQRLVPRLASRIRSLSAGASGRVKLRLTLDASGRVTGVAFISGTLTQPSLKAELKRLLGAWRFGVLPEKTRVVLTLRFSS
jgi:Ca-activated chloride channel family protein